MKGAESHRVPPEAAFADVYLTDEERRNVEIVDANSEYVVFYKKKSRRSVKWDRDEEGGAPDGPFLPSTGSNDTEQSSSSNENASQTKRKEQNTPPAPISSRIGYYARSALRWMMRYKAIKILQVILAFYVGFLTYADIGPPGGLRDQETGLIVDQASEERTARGLILVNGHVRPIVATTMFQVVCIGITRMSAFFMYPALVLVYISKLRATTSILAHTPLAMFMYGDQHELHVYCGWNILIFSLIHTIFHLARWGQQGNLNLLVEHASGFTGLLIIISCILICIPMTIFRQKIRYEIRKNLHYLFLLFAFALCFHTPTSAMPNGGFTAWVFGIILVWYFLDAGYCYFFMTEKIDTTNFHVLPTGVRMTMNVSKRFQKMGAKGGICYVCLPWVSKDQWHAFSLFENPSNPAMREIFMMKLGDWTTKVHHILQRDTVRPCWVQGPFPSPYNSAEEYDNQILVASGIGITPALSVIRAHKDTRRINLIWAVRDKHLLEFFLKHLYLDHEGWNLIFYTGKEKLNANDMKVFTNTNICIIEGRPTLKNVIPNIIYGIESGLGFPERYNPEMKEIASQMLSDRMEVIRQPRRSLSEQAEDLEGFASELGFHLPANALSKEMKEQSAELGTCDLDASVRSATIMEHLALGFRPWEYHDGASEFVKNLDKSLVIPTWGILYCGGAKKVEADLKKISEEYQLQIHIESFAW